MDRSVLARKPMTELKDIAAHLNMRGYQRLRKAELVDAIIQSGGDEAAAEGGASGDGSSDDGASGDGPSGEESSQQTLDTATDADDAAANAGGETRTRTRKRTSTDTNASDARSTTARADDRGRTDGGQPDGGQPDGGESDGGESDGGQSDGGQSERGQDGGQKATDGDGEDGDDDGSANRKRRNRRDRRRRNRDRPNDETSGGGGGDAGEVRAGVLDILPEGYGFLRTTGYLPGERDVYASQGQIRKHGLRRGDVVQGPIRPQRNNEKVPALHHVQTVNGEGLEGGQVPERPDFDDLPVVAPDVRIRASAGDAGILERVVDLFAPLAEGKRALVSTPPLADGSAVLRDLAAALTEAHEDSYLMYVVLDARPEDVRAAKEVVDGEVIASTFEQPAEEHAQIAELALERARRLVELGHDVVVVLDSITRLARAYGVTTSSSGKTLAPDVDAASLYPPKRFMSSARAIEDGGSLTVLATLLTHTGSPHDEVIAQELRRTANTDLVLDPTLALLGIDPPVDVMGSWTREAAVLQDDDELRAVTRLRRSLAGKEIAEIARLVIDQLSQTDDNDALVGQVLAEGVTETA